jgi:hypothetical protein
VELRRPASSFRRLIAGGIDLLAGLLLGAVLANTPAGFFFATRAVVMLRIGAPDTLWKGPVPMLMGIAGTFVYSLPFALLVVALCEPLFGNSPGKALLGLASARGGDAISSRRRRWLRAFVRAAPWWGLTAALLAGSWVLALVFSIVALAFVGNAAVALVTSGSSRT